MPESDSESRPEPGPCTEPTRQTPSETDDRPEPASADKPDPSAWHRLSPLSAVFFIFDFIRQVGFQAAPGLIVLFAALGRSERSWELPAAIGLLVLLGGYGLLSWLRFRYRVAGRRVQVRKGVLHREELDIEFERIQNINIREPFYMRPLGLAVLAIDTAGSSGKEIDLGGIDHRLALGIRDRILAAARQRRIAAGAPLPLASPGTEADSASGSGAPAAMSSASQPIEAGGIGAPAAKGPSLLPIEASGSGAPAAIGEEKTLLALERRDVLIYGLTANVMLWAAIAIGAIFGTGDVAEDTIDQLISLPLVQETVDLLRRRGGALLLALALFGLFLLMLLLLPLISMLGALFRYDGYRLTRLGDTFRRSSGLLTRHDESVRRHKIQAVVWKQNAMALLFGRINLQLRQASAGAGQDAGPMPTGRGAFLVPALTPRAATELSGVFLPGAEPDAAHFTPIDRARFLRVHLAIVLAIALPATLLPTLLVHPAFLGVAAVVGLGAWLILQRVARRFGWAVEGGHGYFRKGFIGSSSTVFPLFKVQRVDLQQTPLQRRSGVATITVHLASHSLTMPYLRMADAERLRDLALQAAEASRERWF